MITTYLMIGVFLGGWLAGATFKAGNKWTAWEAVGTFLLCLVWPFLAFVMFKMWKDGKL